MTDTPHTAIMNRVFNAAYETCSKWPGDSDAEKACRAIEAYELGYVELTSRYDRDTALSVLDPGRKGGPKRPPIFGVSERHIRRVETIRKRRPDIAARLERIAMRGTVSLEVAEHLVIHPPSADSLEAVWLAASDKARAEFMSRLGK